MAAAFGKESVALGAAWMVGARMAERLLGLASTVVLARLLAPSDFGLVAMAMVFVAAADLLGAFGLDWALVRQPQIERRHLDTAWTIRVTLGLLSFVVLAAGASSVAMFYREPRIGPMIVVLGASLLIGATENPGVVMFRRNMVFSREFLLRAASKLCGAVVAIGAALALRSYWALLLGTLASRVTTTSCSYLLHPHRPRFTLSARAELMSFSIWLWIGNMLTFVRTRIVELILGRLAGPRELGLFSVANELSQLASTELAAPINRALFSAYAARSDRAAMVGESYLQATPVIWLITLPIVVGTFAAAPQIVLLMLGDQWGAAVPLLKVLAVAAVAALLSSGSLHVYWAINKPRLETALEVVWVGLTLTLVLILTPMRGVIGAAEAVVVANFVLVPVNFYLLRRYAGVSVRRTFGRVWRTAIACAAMAMVLHEVAGDWSPADDLQAVRQIVLVTLLGAATYVATLLGVWLLGGRPDGPERDLLQMIARKWRRPGAVGDRQ